MDSILIEKAVTDTFRPCLLQPGDVENNIQLNPSLKKHLNAFYSHNLIRSQSYKKILVELTCKMSVNFLLEVYSNLMSNMINNAKRIVF